MTPTPRIECRRASFFACFFSLCFSHRFFAAFWSLFGSKTEPKRCQKRRKNALSFATLFFSAFLPFPGLPEPWKLSCRLSPVHISAIPALLPRRPFSDQFCIIFGPFLEQKPSQKAAQKNAGKKSSFFVIFGRFWPPFWRPKCSMKLHLIGTFALSFRMPLLRSARGLISRHFWSILPDFEPISVYFWMIFG
jgi:hypothetical protein